LTDDERSLLGLLKAAAPPAAAIPSRPGLSGPLRIALRSTRILMRHVLGRDLGEVKEASVSAPGTPMFFSCDNEIIPPSQDLMSAPETQDAA
jgi:hypothetical protein